MFKDVEELTERAGTALQQPCLPKDGIPKQWLFCWIRWPIRAIMLPFIWLDLWAESIARKIVKPPFKKVGHCLKRGNCCYYILIPKPEGILNRLYFFWSTQINGFYLRSDESLESNGKKMVVMGCRYLKKDGSCAHYHFRPMGCRKWPEIERFGRPFLLKGCGFQPRSNMEE